MSEKSTSTSITVIPKQDQEQIASTRNESNNTQNAEAIPIIIPPSSTTTQNVTTPSDHPSSIQCTSELLDTSLKNTNISGIIQQIYSTSTPKKKRKLNYNSPNFLPLTSPAVSGRGRGRGSSAGRGGGRGKVSPFKETQPITPIALETTMNTPTKDTTPPPILNGTAVNLFDEDYQNFVASLFPQGFDSNILDDDDEWELEESEDEDDEDTNTLPVIPIESSPTVSELVQNDDNDSIYNDLEAELGSLLEEDLQAAVTNLLQQPASSPSTPQKSLETQPTPNQIQTLRQLLSQHYQLLLQQSILAIRTAYYNKLNRENKTSNVYTDNMGNESSDDLIELLDGSIGMLQDLYQNRNDGIRHNVTRFDSHVHFTRSAFRNIQDENQQSFTIFDIQGIKNLNETLSLIDNCCQSESGDLFLSSEKKILQGKEHNEACVFVLQHAGAHVNGTILPSRHNFSNVFTYPIEVLGNDSFLYMPNFPLPPLDAAISKECLPKSGNRNQFTSSEDNLILRGINLYGEKEWLLISDRFLPDRSVSIISQRYSRLCYLFYKANGVQIDPEGNLPNPPVIVDDKFDENAISKLNMVKAPLTYDVHRWSLEEDLTLLKSVPIFGNNWAVIRFRLIPHRDRGHLRKRYQVLERRIKSTLKREKKERIEQFEKYSPKAKVLKKSFKKENVDLYTASNSQQSQSFTSFLTQLNQKSLKTESNDGSNVAAQNTSEQSKDDKIKEDCSVTTNNTNEALICSERMNSVLTADTSTRNTASLLNNTNSSFQPAITEASIDVDATPIKKTVLLANTPITKATPIKKTSLLEKVIASQSSPHSKSPNSTRSPATRNLLKSTSDSMFATPTNTSDCSRLGFEKILKENDSLLLSVDKLMQSPKTLKTPDQESKMPSASLMSVISRQSTRSKSAMTTRSSKRIIEKILENQKDDTSSLKSNKNGILDNEIDKPPTALSMTNFPVPLSDVNLLSGLSFQDQVKTDLGEVVGMTSETNLTLEGFSRIDLSNMMEQHDQRRFNKVKSQEAPNTPSSKTISSSRELSSVGNLMAHDLEAISALNSLSSKSLQDSASTASSKRKGGSEPSPKSVRPKRSFFAKAVGSIQEKKAAAKR